MPVRDRVADYRRRMREQGLRPVQIWLPDVRTAAFAREAAQQSALVAHADALTDDQAFVDAISAPWEEA